MKVAISRVSWHAILYKWFYNTWKMPASLCGYFWKMVIAVLISPILFILSVPSLTVIRFFKGWKWFRYHVKDTHPAIYAFAGTMLYLCIWIFCHTVCFAVHIINHTSPTNNDLISTVLLIFSTTASIYVFICAKYSAYKSEKENNEYTKFRRTHPGMGWLEFYNEKDKKHKQYMKLYPSNWLLTKAIVGWYNKACPLIDWTH